jgi:PTS system nitrogen regulatory IIA component
MAALQILRADTVSVANKAEGIVRTKSEALRRLALLLAPAAGLVEDDVERVLAEREKLQSTGVGGGVAIPHGSIDGLEQQFGAVLLCPNGIDFDAIDGAPVSILFAVIGPKRAAGEHLKTLARVSRLLRDDEFRRRLLTAPSGRAAYDIIAAEAGKGGT